MGSWVYAGEEELCVTIGCSILYMPATTASLCAAPFELQDSRFPDCSNLGLLHLKISNSSDTDKWTGRSQVGERLLIIEANASTGNLVIPVRNPAHNPLQPRTCCARPRVSVSRGQLSVPLTSLTHVPSLFTSPQPSRRSQTMCRTPSTLRNMW